MASHWLPSRHSRPQYAPLEATLSSMETRASMVNSLLRYQRQLRGWSLQHVVDRVCKLCEDEERIPGINADMVGKWERGEKKPSPYYQTRLCELYQTSAD